MAPPEQERKMKKNAILFVLPAIISLALISVISVALHEMGHFITSTFLGTDPYVTYCISGGYCHYGVTGPVQLIIINLSGGLFASAVLALLWLCSFGLEKKRHMSPMSYAMVVVCLKQAIYGIEEGFMPNYYSTYILINAAFLTITIMLAVLWMCRKKVLLWIQEK